MQTAEQSHYTNVAPRMSAAELCWQQLRDTARRACMAHAEGRELEARRVTAEQLSPLVDRWSSVCPLGTNDKKLLLQALLDEEQERAQSLHGQLGYSTPASDEADDEVVDLPPLGSGSAISQGQIRRVEEPKKATSEEDRVPLDDISGMIDAALAMRDKQFTKPRNVRKPLFQNI